MAAYMNNGSQPPEGGPPSEHSQIGVSMGTVVCNRIVDVMPVIQQHLLNGGDPRGITVRIIFRAGQPHEAPVVADLEFSALAGDEHQWFLAPSASTGNFTMMSLADPDGANQQAPAQQQFPSLPVQQQAPPLPERQKLAPPNVQGLEAPPAYAPLTAPIESLMNQSSPPPQAPALDQSALLQQLMATLSPEQQAQFANVTNGAPLAPAAAPRRVRRPRIAGDV